MRWVLPPLPPHITLPHQIYQHHRIHNVIHHHLLTPPHTQPPPPPPPFHPLYPLVPPTFNPTQHTHPSSHIMLFYHNLSTGLIILVRFSNNPILLWFQYCYPQLLLRHLASFPHPKFHIIRLPHKITWNSFPLLHLFNPSLALNLVW